MVRGRSLSPTPGGAQGGRRRLGLLLAALVGAVLALQNHQAITAVYGARSGVRSGSSHPDPTPA